MRCGATGRLEVHHVIAAEDGGSTTMENCVTLCFVCHVEAEAENRG
jgi:5-methylcytosine-specific restriction endonuclease McrA